jgi:hypothetical protein
MHKTASDFAKPFARIKSARLHRFPLGRALTWRRDLEVGRGRKIDHYRLLDDRPPMAIAARSPQDFGTSLRQLGVMLHDGDG